MNLCTAFMLPVFCRLPSLNLPRDAMNWTSSCTDIPDSATKLSSIFGTASFLPCMTASFGFAAEVRQAG